MITATLVHEVRATVVRIPPGAVTTYGDIARALGVGARAVGRAMGMLDGDVPWHRVVYADGTPASCHEGQARGLLRGEKTPMISDRVDLGAARWDPYPGSTRDSAEG
ncbi:MAG: cysteine methyltransferase [Pseudonocardiales bacterium]|nr:MAG: cysteine methyltransferase [Pseudonocardiales bacterium]